MNCLKNYIGLKYCGSVTPESGFYINDMAGGSIKSLDKLANSETDNYINLWDKVQNRTLLKFKTQFLNRFNKYTRINNKVYKGYVGRIEGNEQNLTQTNELIGLRFRTCLDTYKKLKFSKLSFYSENAEIGVKFYIYNLIKGEKLKEFTFDLEAGYNQLSFDFTYFEDFETETDLFICYDSNDVISKDNDLNVALYEKNNCCYTTTINGAKCNNNLIPNINNTTLKSGASGLSLQFIIDCDIESLICQMKENLIDSLSLALYASLLEEKLYSERMNLFTVEFSHEELNDLIDKYTKASNDSLDSVFENLEIPCNECFDNNSIVRANWRRP